MRSETEGTLSILIKELDDILRHPTWTPEERILRIKALLYDWVVGNDIRISEVRTVRVQGKDYKRPRPADVKLVLTPKGKKIYRELTKMARKKKRRR